MISNNFCQILENMKCDIVFSPPLHGYGLLIELILNEECTNIQPCV